MNFGKQFLILPRATILKYFESVIDRETQLRKTHEEKNVHF